VTCRKKERQPSARTILRILDAKARLRGALSSLTPPMLSGPLHACTARGPSRADLLPLALSSAELEVCLGQLPLKHLHTAFAQVLRLALARRTSAVPCEQRSTWGGAACRQGRPRRRVHGSCACVRESVAGVPGCRTSRAGGALILRARPTRARSLLARVCMHACVRAGGRAGGRA